MLKSRTSRLSLSFLLYCMRLPPARQRQLYALDDAEKDNGMRKSQHATACHRKFFSSSGATCTAPPLHLLCWTHCLPCRRLFFFHELCTHEIISLLSQVRIDR